MGAGGAGKGFAPQRFTTSHAAALERGAPMIEAGLWYRPSYFPRPGETTGARPATARCGWCATAVGVAMSRPWARSTSRARTPRDFLDFVYTNTFSTLPVGRARYGLMLREDGYVMDDGTCARLGQNTS